MFGIVDGVHFFAGFVECGHHALTCGDGVFGELFVVVAIEHAGEVFGGVVGEYGFGGCGGVERKACPDADHNADLLGAFDLFEDDAFFAVDDTNEDGFVDFVADLSHDVE